MAFKLDPQELEALRTKRVLDLKVKKEYNRTRYKRKYNKKKKTHDETSESRPTSLPEE